jgi:hypothetical protein
VQAEVSALEDDDDENRASGAPRDERECPHCAELILKKARGCKHGGRDVEPLAGQRP